MSRRSKKGLESPDFDSDGHLSALLSEVRLIAASVAEFSIGAGRGLAMEGPPYFFLVLEGECSLHQDDREPVRLQAGDSILGLRGDLARLSLTDDAAAFDPIGEVWRASGSPPAGLRGYDMLLRLTCGEGRAACRVMGCALVLSRSTIKSALIRQAPPIITLGVDDTRLDHWTAAVSATFRRDGDDPDTGYAIASTALAQFLLIEQLKAYLIRDHDRLGASIAIGGERNIGRLIRKLQQEPAAPWSIASMAREAAMSRTTFIEAFADLTGMTPFRFLAACRMDKAAELLRLSDLGIDEIASLCGYQSSRAFREAFLRAFRMTPRTFRTTPQNVVEG